MIERPAGENLPGGIVLGQDSLVRLLHGVEGEGQVVKNGRGGELQIAYAVDVAGCGLGAMLETCGSAGKDVKEGAPSRMMIES